MLKPVQRTVSFLTDQRRSVHHQLVVLWQFCRVALEHGAKEVRELAVRIILSLYQQHRGHVLDLLPPRDAATPKNFLYKTLFDGFSRIDGRLMEAQVTVLPAFSAPKLQPLSSAMEGCGPAAPAGTLLLLRRGTQISPKTKVSVYRIIFWLIPDSTQKL